MREDVQAALDTVRPQLQADGGDCELVDVLDDGTVKVRLTGACGGCPMSQMTLKMGIERVLKERVPSVKTVEAVQASGLRSEVKIVLGGAPVSADFAAQIGADGYAADAGGALKLVKRLMQRETNVLQAGHAVA